MKRFLIVIIFAAVLSLNFTSHKAIELKVNSKSIALDLSKIDGPARNILINSIAFQHYSKIKYAALSGKKFHVNKMMDTPDSLMPIN